MSIVRGPAEERGFAFAMEVQSSDIDRNVAQSAAPIFIVFISVFLIFISWC
jgi:hypothetical protein